MASNKEKAKLNVKVKVKFWFVNGLTPKTVREQESITRLAYEAARRAGIRPKEILVRARVHNTTTVGGRRRPDPKGWHWVFSYKDEQQVKDHTHTTLHGYVLDRESYELTDALPTDPKPKPDATKKAIDKKAAWSRVEDLEQGPELEFDYY